MERSCETCDFSWHNPYSMEGSLVCRRHAPHSRDKLYVDGISPDDWCGYWEPKGNWKLKVLELEERKVIG
jgi:hypothetical protein